MKIAILGATGYIGRSLALALANDPHAKLVLFVRDLEQAEVMLGALGLPKTVQIRHISTLLRQKVDVVVNATGIGSPRALLSNARAVFEVTESMDALVMAYCERYPGVRVFNISTGAVFGESSGDPITLGTKAVFNPDAVRAADYYAVAKLASELKHRAYAEIPLIDLRLFSFFSTSIDVRETFLLSQIVASVRSGEVFVTSSDDIARDYVTPEALVDVLFFLLGRSPENTAYDLRSAAPVTKLELLEYFARTWNLRVSITGEEQMSPTGKKHAYYSNRTTLADLGCIPKYTSLQGIDRTMREMR